MTPAPARLVLIRHGETDNVSRIFRGPEGGQSPLNAEGFVQAARLAQNLKALELPAPRVYASTYLRAQQTAQAIADALGVPLHILDDVHEIDTGAFAGRPYAHLTEFLHEMTASDGQFGFPGGESLAGVGERFHAALLGVLPQPGETVLIVSHGAALVAILSKLLKLDPRETWLSDTHRHENTAVTDLVWHEGGQPEVIRLADAGHLL
ncbi:histidine phosphatase family protein [Deinococcus sp. KNUC1210]|uniref:histidine phosphatase family protein n=1 Tax=Deinococcus sp. KNUC1210 TaxID=2917691 RepID=UPI001EF10752|nr:histidine phosphatase family protein [Deinococcus sp. KNUC1210]ULH16185.1 histidine phosphatase family protein [Deinococcus sp. KNUC1210]